MSQQNDDLVNFVGAMGQFAQSAASLFEARVSAEKNRLSAQLNERMNAFLSRFTLPLDDENRITTKTWREELAGFDTETDEALGSVEDGYLRNAVKAEYDASRNNFELSIAQKMFQTTTEETKAELTVEGNSYVTQGNIAGLEDFIARNGPDSRGAYRYFSPSELKSYQAALEKLKGNQNATGTLLATIPPLEAETVTRKSILDADIGSTTPDVDSMLAYLSKKLLETAPGPDKDQAKADYDSAVAIAKVKDAEATNLWKTELATKLKNGAMTYDEAMSIVANTPMTQTKREELLANVTVAWDTGVKNRAGELVHDWEVAYPNGKCKSEGTVKMYKGLVRAAYTELRGGTDSDKSTYISTQLDRIKFDENVDADAERIKRDAEQTMLAAKEAYKNRSMVPMAGGKFAQATYGWVRSVFVHEGTKKNGSPAVANQYLKELDNFQMSDMEEWVGLSSPGGDPKRQAETVFRLTGEALAGTEYGSSLEWAMKKDSNTKNDPRKALIAAQTCNLINSYVTNSVRNGVIPSGDDLRGYAKKAALELAKIPVEAMDYVMKNDMKYTDADRKLLWKYKKTADEGELSDLMQSDAFGGKTGQKPFEEFMKLDAAVIKEEASRYMIKKDVGDGKTKYVPLTLSSNIRNFNGETYIATNDGKYWVSTNSSDKEGSFELKLYTIDVGADSSSTESGGGYDDKVKPDYRAMIALKSDVKE